MNKENKLPPDFKAKWVAALRSGEYKQGRSNLYDSEKDAFCCLGVAGVLNGCSLASMDQKSNPVYNSEYSRVIPGVNIPLLFDTMSWISDIIHMNDNGESFSEIADYIEKNL